LKPLETIFGRFSKPLQTNSNLNLKFGHAYTNLAKPLLSLFPFLANRLGEGKDLLGNPFWSPEICKSARFVVYSLDSRGGKKPEGSDARPSLLFL
jgi:hypothetical protein